MQSWEGGGTGLLQCLRGKESTFHAGDLGSIPELGRSSGGRQGNPLQFSGLENPMDRGAWWAAVQGVQGVRQDGSDLA